jgi:hypothetical protein
MVISEWWTGKDLEEIGRDLILRYYLDISMAEPRNTTKNFSQDSRFSGRDLINPGPPKYKAGV